MKSNRLTFVAALALVATAPFVATPLLAQRATTPADAGRLIGAISHDSLQGRAMGTPGNDKAARIIANEMQRLGLVPGGDNGYLQRIPLKMMPSRRPGGPMRLAPAESFAALDTVPAERRGSSQNVVGIIVGSDPALRDEVVLVGAHFDHLAMNGARAVEGDSIFNGADDDASGVAAILEAARQLKEGPAPKRTIVIIAFTGEETGGAGTQWYIKHPVRPMAQTVAQLQVEMIGRPDSLAGGAGKGWLTGYERSTMGERLAAAGLPVIVDPRPAENFFQRSDNYAFALEGIPAHTFSSFGGHTDYHGVNDEVDRMDLRHVATMIDATAKAVRVLTDGPRITWKPGGQPARRVAP
jgi:Peptidase family M28